MTTRAQAAGMTGSRSPKKQLSRARKYFAGVNRRIRGIAEPWEDVDSSIDMYARELQDEIDEFVQRLEEAAEFAEEEIVD